MHLPKIVSFGAGQAEPPLEEIFSQISLDHTPPRYAEQGKPRGRKAQPAKGAKPVKKGPKAKKATRAKSSGKPSEQVVIDKSKQAVDYGECCEEECGFEEDPMVEPADAPPRVRRGKAAKGKARRGHKTVKRPGKAKASTHAKEEGLNGQAPAGASAKEPETTKAKKRQAGKAVAKAEPKAPAKRVRVEPVEAEIPAELGPWNIPDDSEDAPDGATCNGVYSCAYRKAQSQSLSPGEARIAGKRASWLLRVHRKISPSLSGVPRKARKAGA